jgi:hypothetical protein
MELYRVQKNFFPPPFSCTIIKTVSDFVTGQFYFIIVKQQRSL